MARYVWVQVATREGDLKDYPSNLADRFIIRLPDGWRDAIKARAAANRRSMNQEILTALECVVGAAAVGQGVETGPAAAGSEAAAR
jgi:plasmid stability protein